MRELLDPEIIAQFEREAQRLDPERRARGVEGVADLLRMLGPARRRRGRGAPRAVDHGLEAASGGPRPPPRSRGSEGESILRSTARMPRRRRGRRHLAALIATRARSRSRSPEPRGSRRSKTPAACATRSAWRCPSASRTRSSSRSPIRSATSWRGTHARTARSRRVPSPERLGRRRRGRPAHPAAPRIAGPGRERLLPAASTDSGDGAGGVGRDRVVRRRGAAAAADALARGDPRQRRAGLAGGVRALPAGVAARHPPARGHRRRRGRHRAARGRADPGERVGVARAARPRLGLRARRCSTSSPRPARSSGRGTAPPRPRRLDRAAPGRRGAAHAAACRRTRSPRARSRRAARRARERRRVLRRAAAAARPAPRTSSRSSRRCGT